ncbi:MAG: hypothetical protein GF363_04880 [Chitinivibrionales bacterium]|nr:hypothetical protein [Chitinivibrionales bacterium]
MYADGSPAVRLRPADYLPAEAVMHREWRLSIIDAVTDSRGCFTMTNVEPEAYSLEINDN